VGACTVTFTFPVGVASTTCGDWEADREQETSNNMVANPIMKITDNFLTMFSSLKQTSLFLIIKEILAQPFYIVKRRILLNKRLCTISQA
jgi:hypothetical protein